MEKELIIITAIISILLFAVCFILVIILGKRLSRTERKLKQAQEDIEKTRNTLNHPRITDVTVEQGDTKKAVVVTDAVTTVGAMSKLYMTTVVA